VMIAEKMADLLREKNTVQAIQEYLNHLYEVHHKHVMDEDEIKAHKIAEEKERLVALTKEAAEKKEEGTKSEGTVKIAEVGKKEELSKKQDGVEKDKLSKKQEAIKTEKVAKKQEAPKKQGASKKQEAKKEEV